MIEVHMLFVKFGWILLIGSWVVADLRCVLLPQCTTLKIPVLLWENPEINVIK